MSRNFIRSALCGVLAATGVASFAMSASSAVVAKAKPTKVLLHSTALGKVLATNSGFTLYVFTRDGKNNDACVHVSGCTGTWPVLKTSRRPIAGKGVKRSRLGTITLANGVKQVTYAGHPLYRYVGDSAPGQTDYVGTPQFGGTWYAINAAGKVVK